jgi:hypothetical protein
MECAERLPLMVLEILFMDWDRHKMVAEVSQLMGHEYNA